MTLLSFLLSSALLLASRPQEAPPTFDSVTGDQAREDVLFLNDLLERVHPDPYSGFGGRVEYNRRLRLLLDGIGDDPMERPELRRRIAEFLGELGDGHTGIGVLDFSSGSGDPPVHLPVRFQTAHEGIFISDALPDFEELSGAQVLAVEGLSIERLSKETRIFFPQENISGSLRSLAGALGSRSSALQILPGVGDSLRLEIRRDAGDPPEQVTLGYTVGREEREAGLWPKAGLPLLVSGPAPFYSSMLADGGIGYLRISAMWSREALESMQAAGRTDIDRWLEYAYSRQLGTVPPEDEDEAIATFPSLIEEVVSLLSEMRSTGTAKLIVDLRQNGGGFSIIGEPLLYLLRGEAYLSNQNPVSFATRISEEYLEINGTTLETLSSEKGMSLHPGDYLFDPPLQAYGKPVSRESFLKHLMEEGFNGGGPPCRHGAHVFGGVDRPCRRRDLQCGF